MITIPLDLLTDLFDYKNWYQSIVEEINFIIDESDLNYSKDDLRIDEKDVRRLIKKINNKRYREKLEKLKEREEEE